MTVNKERVQLLVDALDSGRFAQAAGRLRSAKGYCCLGVACVVAMKHGLKLAVEGNGLGSYRYDDEEGILPESVANWYGFEGESRDPLLLLESGEINCATECNDGLSMSLQEIGEAFRRTFLDPQGEGGGDNVGDKIL